MTTTTDDNPEKKPPGSGEALGAFVAAAKERGVEDSDLVALLRQNGWSERTTYRALTNYYETRLALRVPTRGVRREYANDAFVHLIAFISLGFWTMAVATLFLFLIDRTFPFDDMSYAYGGDTMRDTIAWQLATIIVAFPIFAGVSRTIAITLRDKPESADSGVRKWLTYVALVIAAVLLLGDGIWLIAAFLRDDFTTRFALRAMTLGVLSGGIFAYYLSSVRSAASLIRDRMFATLAGVVVLTSLLFGFYWIGSPLHVSHVRADDVQVGRLRRYANVAHAYYDRTRRPAASLKILSESSFITAEPAGTAKIDYRLLGGSRFELCTTFNGEDYTPIVRPFAHPRGRTCFRLDATLIY